MISIPSTFRRFRPFFLLYLRPWLSIRPLPYAVARAIGNTNDMRFSYDHIADVRRVRMRPAWAWAPHQAPHYADSHTSSHASARRISSQSARASSHAHDAVRDAHGGIAVRDEQHRAPLLRQRVNRLQNHGFVVGVEATRRLVEQHQRRVAQEDASQADALPFTL